MGTVFVFDMDGVLIDSVPLHYKAYQTFARRFQMRATPEEFDLLNGKKLSEIVSHLKAAHRLSPAVPELARRYDQAMETAYAKATLTSGVRAVLQRLRCMQCRLALASSATRRLIEFVLKRFKLTSSFDAIVSGDEVTHAKPSPEIYERVRSLFGPGDYYVLEDSQHGIDAAMAAHMRVIRFDPLNRRAAHRTVKAISRMSELPAVIERAQRRCRMIAARRHIEVRVASRPLALSSDQQRAAQELWRHATMQNPSLFDGTMLSYLSHRIERDKMVIECCLTRYSYFLAQLRDPTLELALFPLTVSGVIVDEQRNTLVGKRASHVTEYQGWYEFVPSGGISADKVERKRVLFRKQLEEEFQEEVGLPLARIRAIEPRSLLFDVAHRLYVISCAITLTGDLKTSRPMRRCREHEALHVVPRAKLSGFMQEHPMIPTSRLVAERFLR